MKKLIIAVTLITVMLSTAAQQNFEGKIEFDMSFDGLPSEMTGMMPTQMVTYFKDKKTKSEIKTSLFEKIVITDMKEMVTYTLQDFFGNKMAIRDSIRLDTGKYEIEYVDETREIANYKCKKVIITIEDGPSIDLWYTTEIVTEAKMQYQDLKGFPLEYTMIQEQAGIEIEVTVSATKVEKMKLKKSEFNIPDGYTVQEAGEIPTIDIDN